MMSAEDPDLEVFEDSSTGDDNGNGNDNEDGLLMGLGSAGGGCNSGFGGLVLVLAGIVFLNKKS